MGNSSILCSSASPSRALGDWTLNYSPVHPGVLSSGGDEGWERGGAVADALWRVVCGPAQGLWFERSTR